MINHALNKYSHKNDDGLMPKTFNNKRGPKHLGTKLTSSRTYQRIAKLPGVAKYVNQRFVFVLFGLYALHLHETNNNKQAWRRFHLNELIKREMYDTLYKTIDEKKPLKTWLPMEAFFTWHTRYNLVFWIHCMHKSIHVPICCPK